LLLGSDAETCIGNVIATPRPSRRGGNRQRTFTDFRFGCDL
jgi:hypothetical protein